MAVNSYKKLGELSSPFQPIILVPGYFCIPRETEAQSLPGILQHFFALNLHADNSIDYLAITEIIDMIFRNDIGSSYILPYDFTFVDESN
jgi:hypothetical protein